MSGDDHGTTSELDLDEVREKIGDILTPISEVQELADALVAEVRRLRALVPELEPGRWWQVLAPDGSLWCETSDESEARESMRAGDSLNRWHGIRRALDFGEWRPVP